MLHTSAHLLLHGGETLWPQRGRLGEVNLPVRAGNEHPVDYTAVKVDSARQPAMHMVVDADWTRCWQLTSGRARMDENLPLGEEAACGCLLGGIRLRLRVTSFTLGACAQ